MVVLLKYNFQATQSVLRDRKNIKKDKNDVFYIRPLNFKVKIEFGSKKFKFLLIGVILFSLFSRIPSSGEPEGILILENKNLQRPNTQSEGINDLSYIGLLPGDIVLIANPNKSYDELVPGLYSHVFVYCGRVLEGQAVWDRDNAKWMDPGTPYVIHSSAHNKSHLGLGYSSWKSKVNQYGTLVKSIRITHVNQIQRIQALNWMIGRLTGGKHGYPVGPTYDWGWSHKQISGRNPVSQIDGYYCSEIVWAAYEYLYGIDLDPDGNDWDLTTYKGVSPTELLESRYSSELPMYFGYTPEIEINDQISCSFSIWADMNKDRLFSPNELINQNYTSIDLNSCDMPLGFIQNVLGLTITEEKEFIIPADVDENGDGIDDRTNCSILGYKTGEYANASLKYRVNICAINDTCLNDIPTKSLISPEPTTPTDTTNDSEKAENSKNETAEQSRDENTDNSTSKETGQKLNGFPDILAISSLSIILFFYLFQTPNKRIKLH